MKESNIIQPKISSRSKFPKNVTEVTKEWLEEVLREKNLIKKENKITQLTVEELGQLKGVASDVNRLVVDFDENSQLKQYKLIMKFSNDEASKTVNKFFGNHREIFFYKEISKIKNFPVATAKCFYSEIDDENNFCLLLEDLNFTKSLNVGNNRNYDFETCQNVIQQLARLHSFFWDFDYPFQVDWLSYQNYSETNRV